MISYEWQTLTAVISTRNAAWWSVAATTVGAAISTVVVWSAFAVQRRAIAATREDESKKRLADHRAMVIGAQLKTWRIVNGLGNVHGLVQDGLSKVTEEDLEGPIGGPWVRFLPRAGLPDRVPTYTTDELAALIPLKVDAAINALIVSDERLDSAFRALKQYGVIRRELQSMLSKLATRPIVGEDAAEVAFNDKQLAEVRPLVIELNSLIRHLVAHAEQDFWSAKQSMEEIQAAAERHFGAGTPRFQLNPR